MKKIYIRLKEKITEKYYEKLKIFIIFIFMYLLIVALTAETAGPIVKNSLQMRFVYIAAGSFIMGSHSNEPGRDRDEKQHAVTISKGFYISSAEVTQGQWGKIMGYNPSGDKKCGDSCPVEQVSFNECQIFLKKLNKKERTDKYRLPTEAEWEYACRASSETAFSGGDIKNLYCEVDENLDKYDWYCANSNYKLHPVATKKANKWGLYDMHGNVQEWCQDRCTWKDMWKRSTDVKTNTYRDKIVDPLSTQGEYIVFRGGSYKHSARFCRSANRSCFKPNTKRTYIGFRIIRDV